MGVEIAHGQTLRPIVAAGEPSQPRYVLILFSHKKWKLSIIIDAQDAMPDKGDRGICRARRADLWQMEETAGALSGGEIGV
ncbi:hypothetical protein [Methylovirgula sp. 4M-Z18]|uniref:hypothetical protein n=1 Tax=Methylovirgula sp. 4M-Z18 TaxID=2293567 RepID=UPI000E2EB92B|nr:hypothetical protein [Methylovirgula sp. 4M-Z18]RFB75632.1 hypothetical protein DYH55_21535 [Methylovirgula sp. 4M-Z18]